MWTFRNKALHKGDAIEAFHDPESLTAEVRETFALDRPSPLPQHYSPWFRYRSANEILAKTAFEQRRWVATVFSIRGILAENDTITDVSTMRTTMEEWLRNPA